MHLASFRSRTLFGASAVILGILLLASGSTFAAKQQADDRIVAAVNQFAPQIIEYRHQIHQNPELGNREFETAALVAEHLRSLGIEVTTGIAHTGVVGILEGGRPGPVVAVRADMDALPVTEETPYPFKSTVRTTYLNKEVGVMHACGHDIHTAVPGTVKFIFQPAEEGAPPGEEGGADLMIAENVLENPRPSAIFGLHALAEMDVGKLGYTPGPSLAAVDHFIAKIQGKQAHGAYPHLSIDPVVMAAQAVTALQTIRSRTLPALEPSVITVGIIRGGERFNIIPMEVHLEGTVRTYDEEIRDVVESRMHQIFSGITAAGGGSYTLDYERGSPATINDEDLGAAMRPTLERIVGTENVVALDPVMGGEDFAYYANEIPGFFFRLGQVVPGTTSGGHHTPTFMADDSSVPIGMKAMAALLIDYLTMETER